MKLRILSILVLVLVLSLLAVRTYADGLGAADPYAVLGEAGVTNTGPSVIHGDVGGSTGAPSVTGFPPGMVVAPSVLLTGSATAFSDATTAYTNAQGLGGATNEGTLSLGAGGLTSLPPGVYTFSSATVLLNGVLQLNAGGSNTAMWTFQIPAALTTGSGSSVEVINAGGDGPFSGSITWAVGSDAMLGTTTAFLGTIISQAGDQVLTSATIGCGRVISLDASVTLDTNVIDTPADCMVTGATGAGTGGSGGTIGPPTSPAAVPEPGTFALLLSGLLAMVFLTFRKPRVSSLI